MDRQNAKRALGARIQARLSELGMENQELARLSGIANSSITDYIKGKHPPNALTLGKMAEVLGVTSDWLLGLDDSPAPLPRDLEDSEKELLALYRSKPGQQDKILAMARML